MTEHRRALCRVSFKAIADTQCAHQCNCLQKTRSEVIKMVAMGCCDIKMQDCLGHLLPLICNFISFYNVI